MTATAEQLRIGRSILYVLANEPEGRATMADIQGHLARWGVVVGLGMVAHKCALLAEAGLAQQVCTGPEPLQIILTAAGREKLGEAA